MFVFSYFLDNGEAGVYLATSDDGLIYKSVNAGKPVMCPPDWSGQNITRDPSIIYHDGLFHMVWTTQWHGDIFGYSSSPDLKEWSQAKIISPFAADSDLYPLNVWAPELHFDPVRGDFFIIFSSTIQKKGNPVSTEKTRDNRLYIVRTVNFEEYSDAELFFDPGYHVIDGQLAFDINSKGSDARWIMIFKNEVNTNLWQATRDVDMKKDWQIVSSPIIGSGSPVRADEPAEGPTLLKDGERWLLYWDAFSSGHYGVAQSTDLDTWTDLTESLIMPVAHPRHGSFIQVAKQNVGWSV